MFFFNNNADLQDELNQTVASFDILQDEYVALQVEHEEATDKLYHAIELISKLREVNIQLLSKLIESSVENSFLSAEKKEADDFADDVLADLVSLTEDFEKQSEELQLNRELLNNAIDNYCEESEESLQLQADILSVYDDLTAIVEGIDQERVNEYIQGL